MSINFSSLFCFFILYIKLEYAKLKSAKNSNHLSSFANWKHGGDIYKFCIFHDIQNKLSKDVGDKFAKVIPKDQWQLCQCNNFHSIIENKSCNYKIGLDEISSNCCLEEFKNIQININDKIHQILIVPLALDRMKKYLQPNSWPKEICAGLFLFSILILMHINKILF